MHALDFKNKTDSDLVWLRWIHAHAIILFHFGGNKRLIIVKPRVVTLIRTELFKPGGKSSYSSLFRVKQIINQGKLMLLYCKRESN